MGPVAVEVGLACELAELVELLEPEGPLLEPVVEVAPGAEAADSRSPPGAEHAASVAAAAATPRNARRPSTVGAGFARGPVWSGSVGSGAFTAAGWHDNLCDFSRLAQAVCTLRP